MSHGALCPTQQSSFLAEKEARVKEQEQCQAQESPSKLFTVSYMLEKLSRRKVFQTCHLKSNGKRTWVKVFKANKSIKLHNSHSSQHLVSHQNVSSKILATGPFFCELAAPTAWELDEAHDAEHALKTRLFIHCHKALILPYFLQAFFEMLLTPFFHYVCFLTSDLNHHWVPAERFSHQKAGSKAPSQPHTCLLELTAVHD